MIIDDIADLIEQLTKRYTSKAIAWNFGKDRKWVYDRINGCNVVLSPEFVAGLNHYGYELKLVKKTGDVSK